MSLQLIDKDAMLDHEPEYIVQLHWTNYKNDDNMSVVKRAHNA